MKIIFKLLCEHKHRGVVDFVALIPTEVFHGCMFPESAPLGCVVACRDPKRLLPVESTASLAYSGLLSPDVHIKWSPG